MYNPLIEIKHRDGSSTHVRASMITTVRDWTTDKMVRTASPDGKELEYNYVSNINEIIERLNDIESRNEQVALLAT